jgi:hypothetical protein
MPVIFTFPTFFNKIPFDWWLYAEDWGKQACGMRLVYSMENSNGLSFMVMQPIKTFFASA